MKIVNVHGVIWLLLFLPFATQTSSANALNSDSDFSVKIAVTVNEDDHIMGKLEHSNHEPQYPFQLVTFNPIGEVIQAEPYLFKIIEMTIVQKNVHRLKCTSINDKYSQSSLIIRTIDFLDECKT
jgi:hypothetical protein